MSNLFSTKTGRQEDNSYTGKVLSAVRGVIADARNSTSLTEVSKSLGLESMTESQIGSLNTALETVTAQTAKMVNSLGFEGITTQQQNSMVASAISMADMRGFAARSLATESIEGQKGVVGAASLSDAFARRLPAMEAYDESNNRDSVVYTVAYNFLAAKQNDFGEAFYPTHVVSNDNIGVTVSLRLIQVYDDIKRNVNGALARFNRKNIVKALIDSTILKNEMTRVVPVVRAQSLANFVDPALVPAAPVMLEGESINTAPLKVGVEMDLIGLSQTDTLLAAGVMDRTDGLDRSISLQNIYIKVGADVLSYNVSNLATANFLASPQENYKRHNLAFNSHSLVVNKDKKRADNTALVELADVVTENLILQIKVSMTGSVNIEEGGLVVFGNSVKIEKAFDQNGVELALTHAKVAPLVTKFATAEIFGYTLKAYRNNLNKRQRGQLLDTTYQNQTWGLYLRSPVSVIRPPNADSQTDSGDLASLVAATFVRTSNEAVTTLLETAAMLKEYVDSRVPTSLAPDLFGVARELLEPTYIGESLDVAAVINSVSSHEKAADIQAVLTQKIRDIASRLYRDSGFQAVVETKVAGIDGEPTIIVGTDPMTARYLMVDGDTRLTGPTFNYKVVTTSDERMQGKLVIALGYPDQTEGTLNPIHFGYMLWSPEATIVIPQARGDQISKELTVMPRFRHITNVPVMGMVEVKNIPDVVSKKISIDFHNVP